MEDKLKILTEKLFNEGIEKGNKEASEILSNAKKDAQKIVEDAKKEAAIIVDSARKDGEEHKKKTEAELKLAATQSVSLLKNQISTMISSKLSSEKIEKTVSDLEFVKKMILTLLESWAGAGQDPSELKIYLPEANEKELITFIRNNCKNMLNGGLEIGASDKVTSGFRVGPKDASYVVEFSEESFAGFFREFLRPATRKLIFDN